ncbi:MAG: hypothetical protein ACKOXM_00725 [Agromyces sp.]
MSGIDMRFRQSLQFVGQVIQKRKVLVALATAALVATPASMAAALSNWSTVTTVSATGTNAPYSSVASSSDGSVLMSAWSEDSGGTYTIRAAFATVVFDASGGGTATWSTPLTVWSGTEAPLFLTAGLSTNGQTASLQWVSYGEGYGIRGVAATLSGSTASWGAIAEGVAPADRCAFTRSAAFEMSANGSAVIADWTCVVDGVGEALKAAPASISGNTLTWGGVSTLNTAGGSASAAAAAISADGGRSTIAWTWCNSSTFVCQVDSASATISNAYARWGGVTMMSGTGVTPTRVSIALSADGSVVTGAWVRRTDANIPRIESVSGIVSDITPAWGTPTWVSPDSATDSAVNPAVAMSSDGLKATMMWTTMQPGPAYLQQSSSTVLTGSSQSWTTPTTASLTTEQSSMSAFKMSSDGSKVTAVFFGVNSSTGVTSVRWASGTTTAAVTTWSETGAVTSSNNMASNPHIAISADGAHAVASWSVFDGSSAFLTQVAYAPISAVQPAKNFGKVKDQTIDPKTRDRTSISGSFPGKK